MPKSVDRVGFGARIRALREARGLGQLDLGQAVDHKTGQTQVSRWENGARMPSTGKIAKLADVLGTTTDYLLHGEEQGGSVLGTQQFRAWCQTMAPADLTGAERDFLAQLRWPYGTVEVDWYDDALTMLRGVERKATARRRRSGSSH
jgi:transcriptional regulator with XRE-family HTH domain